MVTKLTQTELCCGQKLSTDFCVWQNCQTLFSFLSHFVIWCNNRIRILFKWISELFLVLGYSRLRSKLKQITYKGSTCPGLHLHVKIYHITRSLLLYYMRMVVAKCIHVFYSIMQDSALLYIRACLTLYIATVGSSASTHPRQSRCRIWSGLRKKTFRKVVVASVAVVGTLWTEHMCRSRDGTVGRRQDRGSHGKSWSI